MCPKGDDPLTIDQNYRQILINVYTNSYFSGTLGIQFLSGAVTLSLFSPSSAECIEAFENSLFFQYVNCQYTKVSSSHFMYDVTIYSWPVYPQENNLHSHDGNPAITDFYCDVSSANSGVYCVFEDIVKNNIRGTFRSNMHDTCTPLYQLILILPVHRVRILLSSRNV